MFIVDSDKKVVEKRSLLFFFAIPTNCNFLKFPLRVI